jgi:hypothetical protein
VPWPEKFLSGTATSALGFAAEKRKSMVFEENACMHGLLEEIHGL